MSDPYEILGVPRHADEAEIRRRYLELVREFSPDRAPERFVEIRTAYDEVRDPAKRLEMQILHVESTDSLDA
ncbi:DnaJ domain-containing protein, partial [Singulisphaera rosea]